MHDASFPSKKANELRTRLEADPRFKRQQQIRDIPPVEPPTRLRRSAKAGFTWGLSRTLAGYVAERDTGIQGKAPKWVVRGMGQDDFYIAKFGQKNGRIEVLSELFNNRLGEAFGFDMAHSGIVRFDQFLYFITRNFRRNEALIHGSLLIAELFAVKPEVLDEVQRVEQEFYSIDFIEEAIFAYCGSDGGSVFQSFVNMLVFDALIGSQDRHAMNWGILRPEVESPGASSFRLAPLFDSARALLWDLPEGKLLMLDNDFAAIRRYVDKSKPCIGPARDHPKVNHCNHFDLLSHLQGRYPHQTEKAALLLTGRSASTIAKHLLSEFPFARGFSGMRKRVITKVLDLREQLVWNALRKGGAQYVQGTFCDAAATD